MTNDSMSMNMNMNMNMKVLVAMVCECVYACQTTHRLNVESSSTLQS